MDPPQSTQGCRAVFAGGGPQGRRPDPSRPPRDLEKRTPSAWARPTRLRSAAPGDKTALVDVRTRKLDSRGSRVVPDTVLAPANTARQRHRCLAVFAGASALSGTTRDLINPIRASGHPRGQSCHQGPRFTDVLGGPTRTVSFLHDPRRPGRIRPTPLRIATGKYRTTPLRGLWRDPPYSMTRVRRNLLTLVNHDGQLFALNLTAAQKADMV